MFLAGKFMYRDYGEGMISLKAQKCHILISLTVNRGFNRGIIILVGGRKANRKPENMNKFSFGHVHLPRIFNQVRYLKTYMFMTKKRTLLLFHGMI